MRAEAAGDKGVGTMRSPVNWALLGLVIERPSYGYELARRFERVYGDVQHVSGDSHIYKALDALEGRSLTRGTPEARVASSGTDRQPKRHYRATATGEHSYREQLIEQMREDRRRSQMLVRQLAVYTSEPLVALEILESIEAACVEEAVRAPIPSPPDGSPVDVGSELIERLAAEESRLAMEAKLPWFMYARREFRALAEGGGSRR
jgi:DNA-binding PadR family transcriptional regulator